jgi:hypothetical protein
LWTAGEDWVPDSAVSHLGHVAASCAVLLDAIAVGNFKDDRPKLKTTELDDLRTALETLPDIWATPSIRCARIAANGFQPENGDCCREKRMVFPTASFALGELIGFSTARNRKVEIVCDRHPEQQCFQAIGVGQFEQRHDIATAQ